MGARRVIAVCAAAGLVVAPARMLAGGVLLASCGFDRDETVPAASDRPPRSAGSAQPVGRPALAPKPPALRPRPPIESFFDVHGDTLSTPEHGHIPLPRGHAAAEARTRIHVSPSHARVLVVTNRGECGPSAVHVVDLVELSTRAVRRLAEGSGWATARFQGEEPRVAQQACEP